jgi:cellulose synthase/poly-beta-1,6-N-acetylglucosamine synthase-like glycosyltransferase
MKKYFVIYQSTKKIECITILWCVLVLLFVHLTSRLANTFSCTLYHVFTPKDLKEIIDLATFLPKLLKCSLMKVKHLLHNKTKAGENLRGHWLTMVNHKLQPCTLNKCLTLLNPSSKVLWKKFWKLKKRWAQGKLETFFSNVHFKYFSNSCVFCICLFNDFTFAMVMLGLKLVCFISWMFMNVLQVKGSKQKSGSCKYCNKTPWSWKVIVTICCHTGN